MNRAELSHFQRYALQAEMQLMIEKMEGIKHWMIKYNVNPRDPIWFGLLRTLNGLKLIRENAMKESTKGHKTYL